VPTVPSNPRCSHLGCKNPKAKQGGVCLDHGGRDTFDHKRYNATDKRQDAGERYHSKHWQTLRQIQLSKQPLCAACLTNNIVTAAHHVDHLFAWQHLGEQAFAHNVFQSLCAPCHSAKTALEQRGIYRLYGAVVTDFDLSDYARVAAVAHK
jgi:5-methylcytosine-specific restriction protein A